MSWRAVPGPEGPALLAARGRDAALGTVVVVLTVGVFAAVGDHGTLTSIQRLDDAWLRLMISGQAPPLTAIAKVFNILGLVVTASRRAGPDGRGRVPFSSRCGRRRSRGAHCCLAAAGSCSGSRAPS